MGGPSTELRGLSLNKPWKKLGGRKAKVRVVIIIKVNWWTRFLYRLNPLCQVFFFFFFLIVSRLLI